jgi:hypothetical protein
LPLPFNRPPTRDDGSSSPIVLPDETATIVRTRWFHVQVSPRFAAVVTFQYCPTIRINELAADLDDIEELKIEQGGALE